MSSYTERTQKSIDRRRCRYTTTEQCTLAIAASESRSESSPQALAFPKESFIYVNTITCINTILKSSFGILVDRPLFLLER